MRSAPLLWIVPALVLVPGLSAQTPTPVSASAGLHLDDDSLRGLLVNMGYDPKKLSKGFLLAIKQDTWTINMQVVISPDGNKLGLYANLGRVEDAATVPASTWMELLIKNGDIDPSAFYYDKDQKKLYLHRSFDNRGVTPASLRHEIDNFASNVRSTSDLWAFTK